MIRRNARLLAWLLVASHAIVGEGEMPKHAVIDLRGPPTPAQAFFARETARPDIELHFCNEGVRLPALLGSFQVGGLFATRSRATAAPTAKLFSQSNDVLLLDVGDLDLGTSFGMDATAIVRLSSVIGIEARYFGITDWAVSPTVVDPLGAGVRFEGFGTTISAVAEQLDYASRFYSFEVNVLPLVTERVPLVLGFRGLQLHESLQLWQTDTSPRSSVLASRANNYLYGFQIGAEPYLMGAKGALRVDGLVKAGIYGNHASQGAVSPLLGANVAARRDVAAFVGEAGLALVYRINRSFALRGGYEVIWINQIALAPDQSRKTNLAVPSAQLDLGSALLHGATASIEFAF